MMSAKSEPVELHADSVEQTAAIAVRLAKVLPKGTVVVLSGPLGAGKTQFVKAFAAACDVSETEVTSPTFVLCKHYAGAMPLTHMDVYRLADVDEFESLGPEDLFARDGITFIEWGERVADALPDERLEIRMEVTSENARRIYLTPLGAGLHDAVRDI